MSTTARGPRVRPVAPELSRAVIDAHVEAFEDGLDINEACQVVGHGTALYYRWAKAGAEEGASDLLREFFDRVVCGRTPLRAVRARTDHIPERLSLDHFREWARGVVLDTGDRWVLEPFQEEIVFDILEGPAREIWLVIPEGNAKTTLMAGVALYHAEHTVSASVPVGASSRDQAKILYRQAEGMILRSPGFGRRFRCYEGTRLIRALASMGRIQIYAADEKTADGVIPTLALLDELHRHRDLGLYRTWRGKLGKRRGRMVAISTAGEPGSEFEDTRDKIRREAGEVTEDGAHIRAVGGGVVLHDWAVRDRKLADDMAAVKAANPLASITVEDLQEKHDSPTTEPEHWLRMTCNIPARVSGQAITAAQWDGLCEPGVVADRSAWSIGFMDLGWVIDCSALGVLVWEGERRRVIAGVRVITPPVDEDQVVTALLDLQEEFGPVGWVYDPNAGAQQMAQQLEKGENLRQVERGIGPLTFFEHPQDPALMALAASRLDEAIRGGLLVHDGNPALRAHVLNAVKKTVGAGEKWRYDRPPDAKGRRRGKYPIDALTGVVMGHSVAVAEQVTRNVMPLVRAVG